MYTDLDASMLQGEMLCLKIPKNWSENFKEEMLNMVESWEDILTEFQEMEQSIDWMKKAVQTLQKAFDEYEWLETYSGVEVPDE